MTALIITPELETSLVRERGFVTVPAEDAVVSCDCVRNKPCHGLDVQKLPVHARTLENHMRAMGHRFIDRLKARGYEWTGLMKMHGPWPSYEFNRHLADVESATWREAFAQDDPSIALPFVFERDAAGPYKDYVLVGDFLKRNVWTEVETDAEM